MTQWIDDAERAIAESLAKMAKDGSVPAANAALKLLADKRAAGAAQDHRAKVEILRDDPVALCRYLGELGMKPAEVERTIGRKMSDDEHEAHSTGVLDRATEIRAIELSSVRRGDGKIEPWMRGR